MKVFFLSPHTYCTALAVGFLSPILAIFRVCVQRKRFFESGSENGLGQIEEKTGVVSRAFIRLNCESESFIGGSTSTSTLVKAF